LGRTLHSERTFFGVIEVKRQEGDTYKMPNSSEPDKVHLVYSHNLFHGSTRHGRQMLDPKMRRVPASYYHPTGPIGLAFRALQGDPRLDDVAIVGLGAGCLAAYGVKGQHFTFYEIDPAVARIASDARFFTYLGDSAAQVRVLIGDGRLLLAAEPDRRFGFLVVDGFTSDAIPVHLLTREAFEVYFRKMRADGLLALHLTSEFFELLPVVRAIAADLGLSGLSWQDNELTDTERIEGKSRSLWAMLARDPAALEPLQGQSGWELLERGVRFPSERRFLWTDNFSSPLSVLR
jgi:hypothetical protein